MRSMMMTGAGSLQHSLPGLQGLRAKSFVNSCMDAATMPSGLLQFSWRGWRAFEPKSQQKDSSQRLAKPYVWSRRRFGQHGLADLFGICRVTAGLR